MAARSAAMASLLTCSSDGSFSLTLSPRSSSRLSLYIARNFAVISTCASIASFSLTASMRRLNVNEIRSSLTGKIACSYTSAASPSTLTADLARSNTLSSSPSYRVSMSGLSSSGHIIPLPIVIHWSLNIETVTNGRANAGLSICGGIHCPRPYKLIVHESNLSVSSITPTSTSSSTIFTSASGKRSTSTSSSTRLLCVYVPYCNISLLWSLAAHFGGTGAYVRPSNSPRRPRSSSFAIHSRVASCVVVETASSYRVAPGTRVGTFRVVGVAMLSSHGRENDASRVGTPGCSFVVVARRRRRSRASQSRFVSLLRNRDLV